MLGLQFAGSPFGFHTIGSTMACSAESYVKIGGMNKRKAAEDFYFMEKLSKNYKIHKIDGTVVYPSSRGSWRVPFGTGQRVNRFLDHVTKEYQLYSPESFKLLKNWISVFHNSEIYDSKYYMDKAAQISPKLSDFLELNDFCESWTKIMKNTKSDIQKNKQKVLWFDGFKTLKLIHFLRDCLYPNENMFEALDSMFKLLDLKTEFERFNKTIPDLETQKEYLKILRRIA